MEIRIGNRIVADDQPVFVVAEIGNNHNGSMELAKRLIDEAIACGADAVKFQVKDIELAFSKELLDSPYIGPHSFGTTYREHKQYLEFSHEEYRELQDYATHKGILWFGSPFGTNAMALLASPWVPIVQGSSFLF